jgi:hypothetical protein
VTGPFALDCHAKYECLGSKPGEKIWPKGSEVKRKYLYAFSAYIPVDAWRRRSSNQIPGGKA